jgi:hypothetical protein
MGHFCGKTNTFTNHVYFLKNIVIQCFLNFSCLQFPFDRKILEELQRELQMLQDRYGYKRHSISVLGYFNILNMHLL